MLNFRKNPVLVSFLLMFAVGAIFSTGIIVGLLIPSYSIKNTVLAKDDERSELLASFYQAWDIIHDQYLVQPIDDKMLVQGAIRGMMESLEDPYSAYMNPEEYRTQNTPLQGEYTGIGAWVDTTGEFLVITSPMPDSPAEKAGILPGDRVISIDGKDMSGLDPIVVLDYILGPEGTIVKIGIERGSRAEFFEFEIERAIIQVPSVESQVLEGNIGYIRLYTFGSNSTEEFRSALVGLIDQNITGLIFDLRNNTGGYVDTAVDITSLLMERNTVLIEEWADGSRDTYESKQKPIAPDIPLVVLINEGSASASEITAGALQDNGRAILVGTRSYGKGYIQNWIPLVDDNGAIRITIARWLTPNGRQIQDYGLSPDVVIEFDQPFADIEDDIQIKKAIDLLTNESSPD